MTPLEMHRLAVAFYEAEERGKPFTLQYRRGNGDWFDVTGEPCWAPSTEYRRKPEPRVCYRNQYPTGLSSQSHDTLEAAEIYSGADLIRTVRFVEDVNKQGESI